MAHPVLEDNDRLIEKITLLKPNNIFVHINEENSPAVTGFLKVLRQACPEPRIMAGGPATLASRQFLVEYPEVDCIIVGERDQTLLELLRRLKKGQSCRDVQGIVSKDLSYKSRQLIPDLDILGEMIQDGLDELTASCAPEERSRLFNKQSRAVMLAAAFAVCRPSTNVPEVLGGAVA